MLIVSVLTLLQFKNIPAGVSLNDVLSRMAIGFYRQVKLCELNCFLI